MTRGSVQEFEGLSFSSNLFGSIAHLVICHISRQMLQVKGHLSTSQVRCHGFACSSLEEFEGFSFSIFRFIWFLCSSCIWHIPRQMLKVCMEFGGGIWRIVLQYVLWFTFIWFHCSSFIWTHLKIDVKGLYVVQWRDLKDHPSVCVEV